MATHITEIGTVFVPVEDQDRALAFYVDKLGFEKRIDFVYGGSLRWIEVAPKGAHNTLALVPPDEGKRAGGNETYCAFATSNLEADHAMLRAKGVEVEDIATKGSSRTGLVTNAVRVHDPVPPQFFFRDVDGNRFLIVQPPK
jgi:catechol 2,3-dioxygenase-like lactoylglutathione lyase family enzyme